MESVADVNNGASPNIQQREPVKLNHIDLLRGVAVLMVVITHVSLTDIHISQAIRSKLLFGQTGVQLFFFLSAYTLCLSMYERKESNQVKNFYLRRFFRIAPLYYVGIVIYYIVFKVPLLNQHGLLENYMSFGKKNVLLNILFLHSFNSRAYNFVVPGGWSIGTEMMFYIMFPFIFRLYSKIKKTTNYFLLAIAALLIAGTYMRLVFLKFDDGVFDASFFAAFILNQLPIFMIGITYFFLDKAGLIKIPKIVSSIAFISFFLFSYKLVGYLKDAGYLKYDFTLPIFFVGISFGFLFSFFKDSKFKLPLLRRIGQLSYSIYICHFLFAYPLSYKISLLIGSSLNGYVVFGINLLVTISLSMVVAVVSERLIEKPGINWGKFFIKKLNAPAR